MIREVRHDAGRQVGREVIPEAGAPARLREVQKAFGAAVRAPCNFDTERDAERFTCGGDALAAGLEADLVPRGPLTGRERLAVYNRQYWYRLFTILQDDFPLLAHVLTYPVFNRLASDYLTQHPSRSPFLDTLADRLPAFVREDARWRDALTVQIVHLEYAFVHAFNAAPLPPLTSVAASGEGGSVALRLQAHVTVLEEDWNLMTAREKCREAEEDYAPRLIRRKGYWAVYRNHRGGTAHRRIDGPRFRLLSALAAGEGLEAACARAAGGLEPKALERLTAELPGWFTEWTALGWFARAGEASGATGKMAISEPGKSP